MSLYFWAKKNLWNIGFYSVIKQKMKQNQIPEEIHKFFWSK